MRVLLIDVDRGNFPNLALMKISRFHKLRGDKVGFNISDPDRVYISVVFTKNRNKALSAARIYKLCGKEILIGGSGYNYNIKLPDEIEYLMPDYELYNIDYGMGFTSRGCIRKCPFCIVPKKEGYIRHHQYVWEFLPNDFNKVVLLDNNFLASPTFKENIEYLIDNQIKVNFNQGLDLRLVNEENARLIAECKYYDFHFKRRSIYVAWDWVKLERVVFRGLNLLIDAGIKPHHIMVYVLTGFNTTFEEDLYRVTKLIKFGVKPYVMIYNRDDPQNKYDPRLKHLQRWINRFYYQFVSWEDYSERFL